jgi:hypothetical protein
MILPQRPARMNPFGQAFAAGNLLKNGWRFCCINLLNCHRQSEEGAGSAGEQPVSNRIDAYTITGQSIWVAFLFVIGMRYGLKKLICR